MGTGRVVQVTNIAPQTTKDQMHTLFGYVGKIEQIHLYPTIREVAVPGRSLVCYVKFVDAASVGVAQHLTNTVFIDRALIIIPFSGPEIPDEAKAFELTRPGPKFAPGVTNQVEGFPPNQVIVTHDPRLIENKLPLYPPLPATTDSATIDEVRRTVMVCNLDRSLGSQDVIELFAKAGEVKYVRFGYRPGDSANYALIEFSDQTDIIAALKMNGTVIAGNAMQVYHSIQAIQKPQPKSDEAAQREIQEAMSRVNEAQSLISAAIDPVMALLKKDKKRSRSRSPRGRYGRSRRSRSRSPRRRHRRSRSRHRRSRSRSGGRRRRSRSRSKSHKRSRRSKSRERKRSRSRSKRRSRSRSKRSRSRSKSSRSSRKDDDRKKEKERRDRDKGDKIKDRDRSSKEKEKVKDKGEKRKKEGSSDKDDKSEREERSKSKSKSKSPKDDASDD